ncbi:hypothetical protein [Flavobacterium lindanitolerans]|uniref:hypothetical protein n=1 Tax=Flavobacterium lindanitolerans TaxID=428988 RepID=UPI0028068779|nr:hypothetical protein [Flavobacterium lindanitolerans]MDQ7961261.1 hypothetical protein [Flavobacterium lindanitolerans]
MFQIHSYNEGLEFHKQIVKCWFLRKLKGGKSYTDGHDCNDSNCLVCRSKEQKEQNIPAKLKVFLLKNNNIDRLVFGFPGELISLAKEFEKIKFSKKDKKKVSFFFIKTGYENWFQKKYSKIFLDKLNRDTCTYCNRNYTLNLVDSRTRAELDHWFPKEKYPLFALSFFNLIPSCHSCNHIKGSPNINWEEALNDYVHPYLIEKDQNFKFGFNYGASLNDYKVEISVVKNSKMEKTLKANNLKEIYSSSSNKELKDLIELKYKYSDNYIDILINKTFNGLLTEEEIYRMVFGIEITEENYHKRPFSKFKHDIIEELKKIK